MAQCNVIIIMQQTFCFLLLFFSVCNIQWTLGHQTARSILFLFIFFVSCRFVVTHLRVNLSISVIVPCAYAFNKCIIMSPRCPHDLKKRSWVGLKLNWYFLVGLGCKINKPYMERVEIFSAATLFKVFKTDTYLYSIFFVSTISDQHVLSSN